MADAIRDEDKSALACIYHLLKWKGLDASAKVLGKETGLARGFLEANTPSSLSALWSRLSTTLDSESDSGSDSSSSSDSDSDSDDETQPVKDAVPSNSRSMLNVRNPQMFSPVIIPANLAQMKAKIVRIVTQMYFLLMLLTNSSRVPPQK